MNVHGLSLRALDAGLLLPCQKQQQSAGDQPADEETFGMWGIGIGVFDSEDKEDEDKIKQQHAAGQARDGKP